MVWKKAESILKTNSWSYNFLKSHFSFKFGQQFQNLNEKMLTFGFSWKNLRVSLCLMNDWCVGVLYVFGLIVRRVDFEGDHYKSFFPHPKGGKKLFESSILKWYLRHRKSSAYEWERDLRNASWLLRSKSFLPTNEKFFTPPWYSKVYFFFATRNILQKRCHGRN